MVIVVGCNPLRCAAQLKPTGGTLIKGYENAIRKNLPKPRTTNH